MSLDLNTVDYQLQDGKIYDEDEDDGGKDFSTSYIQLLHRQC